MKIIISERKVFRTIATIISGLIVLSILGQISRYFLGHERLLGFIDLFNLNVECNVPTFFQAASIYFSAFLVLFILKSNIAKEEIPRHYWVTLFIMLLYMGSDEILIIHERMDIIIELFYNHELHGVFNSSWIIIGIIIALIFIIYFTFLIIRIDKRVRYHLIISAFLFLFGAIVMEMIDGFYYDRFGGDFIYQLLTTLEESAEMFGIGFFIKTLLKYINLKNTDTNINIIFK